MTACFQISALKDVQHSLRNFFVNLNMGKKSSMTDVQRAQIVTLHGEGYTEGKIFEKFECSITAVHNAIAKHKTDGMIFCDRKRSR